MKSVAMSQSIATTDLREIPRKETPPPLGHAGRSAAVSLPKMSILRLGGGTMSLSVAAGVAQGVWTPFGLGAAALGVPLRARAWRVISHV